MNLDVLRKDEQLKKRNLWIINYIQTISKYS